MELKFVINTKPSPINFFSIFWPDLGFWHVANSKYEIPFKISFSFTKKKVIIRYFVVNCIHLLKKSLKKIDFNLFYLIKLVIKVQGEIVKDKKGNRGNISIYL